MGKVKKMYEKLEVLVSDELISASDAEITAAIPNATAGMIIYNAGQSSVKQMCLDGKWVPIATGSGKDGKDGKDGKSAYELAKEQSPEIGDLDSWLASLKGEKGEKGDKGADGKAGAAGKDGLSITAITLKTDADGKVTSGTATLSNETSVDITVTVEPE